MKDGEMSKEFAEMLKGVLGAPEDNAMAPPRYVQYPTIEQLMKEPELTPEDLARQIMDELRM